MATLGEYIASAIQLLNEARQPDTEWGEVVEILSDVQSDVQQAETLAIAKQQEDEDA